jgi:pilus assembly protein CpaB
MTTSIDPPGNRVVRKIRMRAVVFLAAAVVAGIAAVFLVKVYLDQARRHSTAAPIATTPVVVVASDLQSGQRLDATQLAIVRWPTAHVPAGTYQQIDTVVGQTLRQPMVRGEPVLTARLANKAQGQGLAAILDDGARAMAVKVDQVVGIAGFVQPGDRVDVITTIATDDETRAALASKAAKISKIILQDIRVLAVGEHLATDGHKPVKVQVVTLEVQPEESERLALASQHGTIQLTMRSRVDRDAVETAGVTPLALLADRIVAPAPAPADGATRPKEEPRPHTARRAHRVREPAVDKPAAPPQQQSQVIEILRGTSKIEERKVKTGGAQ